MRAGLLVLLAMLNTWFFIITGHPVNFVAALICAVALYLEAKKEEVK